MESSAERPSMVGKSDSPYPRSPPSTSARSRSLPDPPNGSDIPAARSAATSSTSAWSAIRGERGALARRHTLFVARRSHGAWRSPSVEIFDDCYYFGTCQRQHPVVLPVADTAAALGLGPRAGQHSPLMRSLTRPRRRSLMESMRTLALLFVVAPSASRSRRPVRQPTRSRRRRRSTRILTAKSTSPSTTPTSTACSSGRAARNRSVASSMSPFRSSWRAASGSPRTRSRSTRRCPARRVHP